MAQSLLPGMPAAGQGEQVLGGDAARLSSKVAKAEARRQLAPAPDSAFNFRPAVRRLHITSEPNVWQAGPMRHKISSLKSISLSVRGQSSVSALHRTAAEKRRGCG
jgi:hypothetical protein